MFIYKNKKTQNIDTPSGSCHDCSRTGTIIFTLTSTTTFSLFLLLLLLLHWLFVRFDQAQARSYCIPNSKCGKEEKHKQSLHKLNYKL